MHKVFVVCQTQPVCPEDSQCKDHRNLDKSREKVPKRYASHTQADVPKEPTVGKRSEPATDSPSAPLRARPSNGIRWSFQYEERVRAPALCTLAQGMPCRSPDAKVLLLWPRLTSILDTVCRATTYLDDLLLLQSLGICWLIWNFASEHRFNLLNHINAVKRFVMTEQSSTLLPDGG